VDNVSKMIIELLGSIVPLRDAMIIFEYNSARLVSACIIVYVQYSNCKRDEAIPLTF
jgi:hypothetical protein